MTVQSQDDLLDRAIAAILAQPAPAASRARVLNAAIARATRSRLAFLAAAAAVAVAIGLTAMALLDRLQRKPIQTPAPVAVVPPTSFGGDRLTEIVDLAEDLGAPPIRVDAYKAPAVRLIVADDAPVLVAIGGDAPMPLAAATRQLATGKIHLWDFSKSAASRIVPGPELWSNSNVILTPDGAKLFFADGDLLDLKTGELSKVDLGGATYKVGKSIYNRIGSMRFSPDGRRLAFILTLRNNDANNTVRWVGQLVDFPSGKPISQFPLGDTYNLRIAFMPDGRIASADHERRLTLLDAATGDVVRRFEPPLPSQVMAVAVSPDGKRVAAGTRDGDVACWNTATGERAWSIQLKPSSAHLLRFSPDGRMLASADFGSIVLLDPATGQTKTLPQHTTGHLLWSADSKSLTAVTAPYFNDRNDVYPDAHVWDVSTATRLPHVGKQ